jgi:hypothetical protein
VSKRVRERLRRFKDVDVPLDEIARRSRLEPAPRELPDVAPSRQRLVTVVAAFAIFALAASLFFVPMLRSDGPNTQAGAPTGADSTTIVPLDPAAICDVPAYDPTIALLVGNETTAYPKAVLEGSGSPASDMQGPATDELRSYIASSAGQHAPDLGWRVIDSSAQHVIFAAPPGYGYGDWWVVGFSKRDGQWQRTQEEIVEQEPTPAERGHELSLTWTDGVTVRNGDWTDPLQLVNDRSTAWSDQATLWGQAHVFDMTTHQEVATDASTIQSSSDHRLDPTETMPVPLALGGVLAPSAPGTYSIVACVPELGLASPVGELQILEDVVARDAYVITYPSTGGGMTALAGGVLGVKNGCLGLGRADDVHFTYVLLPVGYVVVMREGTRTLIGPTGEAVAAIGDTVSFGGGGTGPDWFADQGITVPDACRSGGGYFLGWV